MGTITKEGRWAPFFRWHTRPGRPWGEGCNGPSVSVIGPGSSGRLPRALPGEGLPRPGRLLVPAWRPSEIIRAVASRCQQAIIKRRPSLAGECDFGVARPRRTHVSRPGGRHPAPQQPPRRSPALLGGPGPPRASGLPWGCRGAAVGLRGAGCDTPPPRGARSGLQARRWHGRPQEEEEESSPPGRSLCAWSPPKNCPPSLTRGELLPCRRGTTWGRRTQNRQASLARWRQRGCCVSASKWNVPKAPVLRWHRLFWSVRTADMSLDLLANHCQGEQTKKTQTVRLYAKTYCTDLRTTSSGKIAWQ